jgi:flagellar basal body-associated protein FliL
MAIIIQEEKSKSNLIVILVALAIVAAAGGLTYYLFFSPAPFVEQLAGSSKFESISRLSNIKIDVEEITDSDVWKNLTRPEPVPAINTNLPSRRSNPFESF